ncbi:MAG: TonB-dependent receptor plug domain-containing protein, partial [bacterium]
NNAFSGEAYVLTDNRQAAVASLGVNVHSIMPNMNVDLDKVEIVRGPGSALYGAGVDEGVIHYITKDPFSYPGTAVSLSGGERTSFAGQFRHAGVINGKLGYKITGQYAQADDWKLNPADSLDKEQLDSDFTDPVTGEKLQRNYDYKKLNVNGLLEYRFSDDVTLTANGGFSSLDAVVLTGVGTAQADGWGYSYGQLRLQAGNFFAQTYLNVNNAGDSFVYGDASPLVDKSTLWNIQAQYNLETWDGKQQFIFGFDYDRTTPNTDSTIYGRNEQSDLISETGGYVQSQTALSSQLNLTAALRLDYNNLQEELVFSPRVALVYKPSPEHSLRATFNRAFTSPGNTENFLDIVAGRIPGTDILMRGRGSAYGFTFGRNPDWAAFAGSDLIAYSLNPATLGAPQPVGLPLDATYASVYAGLSSIPIPVLKSMLPPPFNLIPDDQLAGLIALLDPSLTSVTGFSKGALGMLNRATGAIEPISDVTDIDPLKRNTTQTFEAGYKGLIKERVLFAVDVYYTNKKNFVGPLLFESPFVFVPTLSADLTGALANGITNNAQLAAALGAFGLTPEEVAELIVGLAQSSLPDANTPVAIVDPSENAPALGQTPELLLAYRNFGNVNFWGVDASVQVLATDRLSFFGNLSFVSDDFFDNEELDETNTALSVALNAPSFKTKLGFSYDVPLGISVNASGRYIKGFPVDSGVYKGDVESYFLLDIGAGYDLGRYAPGMRFDIAVQNVLDNEHREFIGAPKIGRFAMARLSYSIR